MSTRSTWRALHELGEQGGWPLTMFLTSDAEPFWGGTYFPKEARYGRPAFVRVLNEDRAHLSRRAGQGAAERRRAEGRGSTPTRAERGRRAAADDAALADLARAPGAGGRSGAWRHQGRAEISASAVLRFPVARRSALRAAQSARGGRRSPSPISRKAASTIISAAASPATASTSAGSCRISRRCSTTTRC